MTTTMIRRRIAMCWIPGCIPGWVSAAGGWEPSIRTSGPPYRGTGGPLASSTDGYTFAAGPFAAQLLRPRAQSRRLLCVQLTLIQMVRPSVILTFFDVANKRGRVGVSKGPRKSEVPLHFFQPSLRSAPFIQSSRY